jgi:hypothetical protein
MEVRYGVPCDVVQEEPLLEVYLLHQGWGINTFIENHPKLGPGYPEFGGHARCKTDDTLVTIQHHPKALMGTSKRQVEFE